MKADPLVIPWHGRKLRVRHDDPRLGPYTHVGQVIRAAVELASDVEGLRLVLGDPDFTLSHAWPQPGARVTCGPP